MASISASFVLHQQLCNSSFPFKGSNGTKSLPLMTCRSLYQKHSNQILNNQITRKRRKNSENKLICQVAWKESEKPQLKAKKGDRIKVIGPLKVFHVPKTPEVDLTGKEGKVVDYIALYKD
eukprot:TRINITY_DN2336_c0_g1_i2.p1 TRINITY_DN2336_c0_g1~~TRINITY_DN2336_c0_g1_i2.p1  ORF type:complete len:138 (-),score=19.08 TRINITY_DN2336_c0_g1_i2:387-749(-)